MKGVWGKQKCPVGGGGKTPILSRVQKRKSGEIMGVSQKNLCTKGTEATIIYE